MLGLIGLGHSQELKRQIGAEAFKELEDAETKRKKLGAFTAYAILTI
jgi:hypothetical protein